MKTTVELPDTLMLEAKAMAIRRRVTFKELLTHALKREIGSQDLDNKHDFDVDDFGIPLMKKQKRKVTNELVQKLQEEE